MGELNKAEQRVNDAAAASLRRQKQLAEHDVDIKKRQRRVSKRLTSRIVAESIGAPPTAPGREGGAAGRVGEGGAMAQSDLVSPLGHTNAKKY